MVLLDSLLDRWKASTRAKLSWRNTVRCKKLASMGSDCAAWATSWQMACHRVCWLIGMMAGE